MKTLVMWLTLAISLIAATFASGQSTEVTVVSASLVTTVALIALAHVATLPFAFGSAFAVVAVSWGAKTLPPIYTPVIGFGAFMLTLLVATVFSSVYIKPQSRWFTVAIALSILTVTAMLIGTWYLSIGLIAALMLLPWLTERPRLSI